MKISEIVAKRPALLFLVLVAVMAVLLILLNIVYLPDQIAHSMGYTGRLHLFVLDMTFTITPAQAYSLLAAYGGQGRLAYAAMIGLFDFVFPFLYGSFLAMGLWLVARTLPLAPRTRRIVGVIPSIPYLATLADWLENVCILVLLFSYPQYLVPIVVIKNILTGIKFLVSGISLAGLLLGAGYLLLRRIFLRRKVLQVDSQEK